MPAFVGLDGYPGGWVAVYLDEQRQLFDYATTAERLLSWPYERAMIDIPIGLPQRGYRDCDRAAKEIIGSSAFLGARWNVWQFREYDDANGPTGAQHNRRDQTSRMRSSANAQTIPARLDAHTDVLLLDHKRFLHYVLVEGVTKT